MKVPYPIGTAAQISSYCIKGTKYRFVPQENGELRAEMNLMEDKWFDLGWTHERSVTYLKEHAVRKDGRAKYHWEHTISLGDQQVKFNTDLVAEHLD